MRRRVEQNLRLPIRSGGIEPLPLLLRGWRCPGPPTGPIFPVDRDSRRSGESTVDREQKENVRSGLRRSIWRKTHARFWKEKALHIIDAHGGMSSPQCRRALDDVIRRLGIAEALSERAIEAVAFRLIDEIRFSGKLGARNRRFWGELIGTEPARFKIRVSRWAREKNDGHSRGRHFRSL